MVGSWGRFAVSGLRPVGPVDFDDRTFYDDPVGHDADPNRLDEGTTVDSIDDWMDWRDRGGLAADGTEPETFLGGAETILTPDLLQASKPRTST